MLCLNLSRYNGLQKRVGNFDMFYYYITIITFSRSQKVLTPALIRDTVEMSSITELVHREENYVPCSQYY